MFRLLMSSRRFGVTIDLDQHKARRIILLLDNVESGYSWLSDALTRIGVGCRFESFDRLGFYSDMNVNDQHILVKRLNGLNGLNELNEFTHSLIQPFHPFTASLPSP